MIDVTLACKVANSKLVEVVTVADVDDEDHVDDLGVEVVVIFFARVKSLCPKIWLCNIFHKFHVCLIVHHIL